MNVSWKKIWSSVGISGLIVIALFGNLIYMNLRPSDPILPGWEEYNSARFAELMAKEEPVMVEIYASWCPTCLLQHKAFETLHEDGRTPQIRAIRVDFERDEEFINRHNIHATGTISIFKGGREEIRASGLITADKIENFITAYLGKTES